jgi:putative transposase
MAVNKAQRLKELEKENARLTRLLAERVRELDLLKQVRQKKG